jgi:hypothetical protein
VKGILFNTDMVKAILDGRKTQTRRPITPQPEFTQVYEYNGKVLYDSVSRTWCYKNNVCPDSWREIDWMLQFAPCQVGDILYVREAWQDLSDNEGEYVYLADGDKGLDDKGWGVITTKDIKWRPSIHMPREAARLFLRVTDVQVERVQDITEENAMAEGIHDDYPMDKVYCPKCKGEGLLGTHDPITLGHIDIDCHYCDTAKKRFVNLWDSTYAAKGYGRETNPSVRKYTFERVEKPNEKNN